MKARKRWLLLLPGALILLVVGFSAWASVPVGGAMPEAEAALHSDREVDVEKGRWTVFQPASAPPQAGLAFYPGARVPVDAYAPMARELAEKGFLVVLMPMPLKLAILDQGETADVIEAFPSVENWAVGGHSLGGVAASGFAYEHPDAVHGLILLASYPQESRDLSGRKDLKVASIYGSEDGLASPEEVRGSAGLLPEDARFVRIEGGNHAQFGWYGPQPSDNAATISRGEQQSQTVAATAGVLADMDH